MTYTHNINIYVQIITVPSPALPNQVSRTGCLPQLSINYKFQSVPFNPRRAPLKCSLSNDMYKSIKQYYDITENRESYIAFLQNKNHYMAFPSFIFHLHRVTPEFKHFTGSLTHGRVNPSAPALKFRSRTKLSNKNFKMLYLITRQHYHADSSRDFWKYVFLCGECFSG